MLAIANELCAEELGRLYTRGELLRAFAGELCAQKPGDKEELLGQITTSTSESVSSIVFQMSKKLWMRVNLELSAPPSGVSES